MNASEPMFRCACHAKDPDQHEPGSIDECEGGCYPYCICQTYFHEAGRLCDDCRSGVHSYIGVPCDD